MFRFKHLAYYLNGLENCLCAHPTFFEGDKSLVSKRRQKVEQQDKEGDMPREEDNMIGQKTELGGAGAIRGKRK
jgi:hypothetical protein